ncbi:hypothetical protein PVK06_005892 [Gossypium arboreum]|uniref:Uncharacterized protein n=1 Tax=Gossypium arboreum TaxID=29729 RepID=A0ABR0QVS2_GOSAR|nr:hypothetical protein PVK06_005892 [Gossypium arboreum]
MDTLHQFLSQSLDANTLISKDHMDLVSSELASAVHQVIVNGAAILSSAPKIPIPEPDTGPDSKNETRSRG